MRDITVHTVLGVLFTFYAGMVVIRFLGVEWGCTPPEPCWVLDEPVRIMVQHIHLPRLW